MDNVNDFLEALDVTKKEALDFPKKIHMSYTLKSKEVYKIVLEFRNEEFEFIDVDQKTLFNNVMSWLNSKERDFIKI